MSACPTQIGPLAILQPPTGWQMISVRGLTAYRPATSITYQEGMTLSICPHVCLPDSDRTVSNPSAADGVADDQCAWPDGVSPGDIHHLPGGNDVIHLPPCLLARLRSDR